MVGISAIGVSRGISGKDSDLTSLPVIFWPDQFLTLGQVSGWQCHELYEAWWRAGGSDKVIVCLTTTSSFTALLDSYLWKPKTIVIRYIFYWHTSWYGGSCFIIQHAFVTFVLFCVNFTNPRACLADWNTVYVCWWLFVHYFKVKCRNGSLKYNFRRERILLCLSSFVFLEVNK